MLQTSSAVLSSEARPFPSAALMRHGLPHTPHVRRGTGKFPVGRGLQGVDVTGLQRAAFTALFDWPLSEADVLFEPPEVPEQFFIDESLGAPPGAQMLNPIIIFTRNQE
jgi:hypothetical protein